MSSVVQYSEDIEYAGLIPDDVATPDDIEAIEDARREYERGETIPMDSIDWDYLDKLGLD